MSKLLKLRDWVTVDEASEHLSLLLGESVKRSDLLRLALDGHLTLSVNFPNHTRARCGRMVAAEDVPTVKFPADIKKAQGASYSGEWIDLPMGIRLSNNQYIVLEKPVHVLDGVFDLPMIGGEQLDVQHEFQQLVGGPPLELTSIDGAFVTGGDGTYWQLQTSYEDNEFSRGSKAAGERLEALLAAGTFSSEEVEARRAAYAADRKAFKDANKEKEAAELFYPAGELPDDSMLVVRTESLFEFLQTVKEPRRVGAPMPDKAKAASSSSDSDDFPLWLFMDWLRYDTWEPMDGLQLLLGVNPHHTKFFKSDPFSSWPDGFQSVVFLDSKVLKQPDERRRVEWTASEVSDDDNLMGLSVGWQNIRDIWRSGNHPLRPTPEYYVQWAETKGFHVPWLRDAREKGRFQPVVEAQTVESPASDRPIAAKERGTYLNIIGGLLELLLGKSPAGQKLSVFEDQASVISALEAHFPGAPGLSKRNLEGKFSDARRSLKAR
jgi:hypothetical protein